MPFSDLNMKTQIIWGDHALNEKLVLDTVHDKQVLEEVISIYNQAEAQAKVLFDMQQLLIDKAKTLKARIPGCKAVLVSHPEKNVIFKFICGSEIELDILRDVSMEEALTL